MIQDPLGHIHRLCFGVSRFHGGDPLAGSFLSPQRFAFAHLVVRDNGAGRRENILCRAIVLLELDHTDPRIVLFKRQDVLNIGAPPTVNGLIFIPDHTDIVVHARQVAD